jgi:hypothetical protein
MPGFANPVPGFGMRFGGRSGGWGGGHGRRHRFYATGLPFWARTGAIPPATEQELVGLKNEAELLKGELEAINRRIDELERKS